MDNKQTGSFYTPMSLIKYMVQYCRSKITPHSVLEPSAGDGRFAEALREFNCPITLVEIDKDKAMDLQNSYSDFCNVFHFDYLKFAIEQDEKYDLVIGNPPYVSKKVLPREQRDLSLKLLEHYQF